MLQGLCAVTLTSIIMKRFKQLVKVHICSVIPAIIDFLPFA